MSNVLKRDVDTAKKVLEASIKNASDVLAVALSDTHQATIDAAASRIAEAEIRFVEWKSVAGEFLAEAIDAANARAFAARPKKQKAGAGMGLPYAEATDRPKKKAARRSGP